MTTKKKKKREPISKYDDRVKGFIDWLYSDTPLSASTIIKYATDISTYYNKHSEMRKSTVKRYLINLSRKKYTRRQKYAFKKYFEYINKPEYQSILPKLKAPEKKKIPKFLNKEEVLKIIDHLPPGKYKQVAILQYASGCRSSEIFKIQKTDIDYSKLIVKIRGKGSKTRYIKFGRKFETIFRRYDFKHNKYFFLPATFNKIDETTMSFVKKLSSIQFMYNRILCKTAEGLGIMSFASHDFRRSFGNYIVRKVGITEAKELLGHASINTTVIYADPQSEEAMRGLRQFQDEGF